MAFARPWRSMGGRCFRRKRQRGLAADFVRAVRIGGPAIIGGASRPRARGEAGRADADFVAELAASLGLPFDLGQWRPKRAGHFESDARCARYAWLTEVARARGASAVAVGHTCDDQAETILHRIVRGTGLRGLAGIPSRRRLATDPPIALVRPLLRVSHAAICEHLAALAQPFREDETNADRTRTRVRIRHDLLPKLVLDYNPRRWGGFSSAGARWPHR